MSVLVPGGLVRDLDTAYQWTPKIPILDAHSYFWAEGTNFEGLGLSNGDPIPTLPNETGEVSASSVGSAPTFSDSYANLNGQPALVQANADDSGWQTGLFNTPPDYSNGGVSIIWVGYFIQSHDDWIFDGIDPANANTVHSATTHAARIQAGGTSWKTANYRFSTQGKWLMVGKFDGSTGHEQLWLNGNLEVSQNAGSGQLTGFSLGVRNTGGQSFKGATAIGGIFPGDIFLKPWWGVYQDWLADHYDMTFTKT